MTQNIVISLLVFALIYVLYLLIKSINDGNEAKQEIQIDWNNIDLLVTDENKNIKAFISLAKDSISEEELNKINQTLIENHGLRIYKTPKDRC